ncbi:MAG: transposon-encoded TnpW family protein [Oscillospiraceae bacterium]|nr:transposon-encoded TnpW family protein [Oscillospiraceae bacterium]
MSHTIELTERQAEIFDEVMEKIDETAAFLAGLSHADRLDWLKKHQYSHPISFEREINGTVYTVNAHFSGDATESAEGKVNRILNRNITH